MVALLFYFNKLLWQHWVEKFKLKCPFLIKINFLISMYQKFANEPIICTTCSWNMIHLQPRYTPARMEAGRHVSICVKEELFFYKNCIQRLQIEIQLIPVQWVLSVSQNQKNLLKYIYIFRNKHLTVLWMLL